MKATEVKKSEQILDLMRENLTIWEEESKDNI